MLEFGVLGPPLIRDGGVEIAVRGRRQQLLLAVLTINANRTLTLDRLIDAVWADGAPATAEGQIRDRIRLLRGMLGACPSVDDPATVLATTANGYLLRVRRTDLDRFRDGLDAARTATAAGRFEEAAQLLNDALAIWRGAPLPGLDAVWIRAEVDSWLEERSTAVEDRIECDLRLGRHRELISELTGLAATYPLRERLHGQLMIALAGIGRNAEALSCYEAARRLIADQLGVDPGPYLQMLYQRLLHGDLGTPSLPVAEGRRVPSQLPADVFAYTGRAAALGALDDLLASSDDESGAVAIAALSGTAGVGKTALAIHWAHRVKARFPDGQLYINLRGYDPDEPVAPIDALSRFLTCLGVHAQEIPPDLDDRAGRYRSEVAGRRMLVVLDNVSTVDQVRPLLPGTPSCMVVITSRDRLPGLVARDGARRLDLDLLPVADAVELLHRLIGDRVDREPKAAAALAERCARLPLALRIAAELTVSCPGVLLADLVDDLVEHQRRLTLLRFRGDVRADVAAVFSWSVRHLPPMTTDAFSKLGLHPGPDFDLYAAAALTGTGLTLTKHALDVLVQAHLMESDGTRFSMHDLLRAYAMQVNAEPVQVPAAVGRLYDYYAFAAATAMNLVCPTEKDQRPLPAPVVTPVPCLPDSTSAQHWLDAERACLAATAAHAATHNRPEVAVQLSLTLYRYLQAGHRIDALTVHAAANAGALAAGDPAGRAHALNEMGTVHWQSGDLDQAMHHYEQAVTLFAGVGDRMGQAHALASLGAVEGGRGHLRLGSKHLRRSLAIYRQTGDHCGEVRALSGLGDLEHRGGSFARAAHHHRQALALARELGDDAGQAWAMNNLGLAELRLGRAAEAHALHRRALAVFRRLGIRHGEAYALLGAAEVHRDDAITAREHHQLALMILRDLGDREGEVWALNGLGEVELVFGHVAASRAWHREALTLAGEMGVVDQQARAHLGLGRGYQASGHVPTARHHYEQAQRLHRQLGS